MPSYSPSHIGSIFKCEKHIVINDEIKFLLNDSRRVIYPKHSIFFAINGQNHNGHTFVSELYNLGVRNFVVGYIPDRFK